MIEELPQFELSASGRQRQKEILRLAKAAAARRRAVRRMTPLAILLAIALAVVQFHQHTPPVVAVKPAAEDAVAIQYIQTDPHIAERLAVKTSRTTWQIIGDNELLAGIAQAGDAGGIAQVNGQPTLVLVDSTR